MLYNLFKYTAFFIALMINITFEDAKEVECFFLV